MSIPQLFLACDLEPHPGLVLTLDSAQARHLHVLRMQAGDALVIVLPSGPWRGDLAVLHKDRAEVCLVAPSAEDREPAWPLYACIPITAQLSLVDDMLPPLVELGVTHFYPVIYARSQYDAQKTQARMDRWRKLLLAACAQSHRSRLPELLAPTPLAGILNLDLAQKWVAYEVPTDAAQPAVQPGPLAFTSGPEGGITDAEFHLLRQAGWQPLSFGKSILRAVTTPVALASVVAWGRCLMLQG